MSYTNHNEGHGVYTYQDYNGVYHCCDCSLEFIEAQFFIDHLYTHKQSGCNIPDEIFTRIKEDAICI